jgi:hypothetical protein
LSKCEYTWIVHAPTVFLIATSMIFWKQTAKIHNIKKKTPDFYTLFK